MSVAHEALQLPLAAVKSPNPLIFLGAAGVLTTVALGAKKITPHWHHTINEGEVGVWLRKGEPILLPGFTPEDVEAAEAKNPWDAEHHYKIVDHGWRLVRPFCTLQTVDVADQPANVHFPVESADEPRQKLEIQANLAWRISPDGDSPVRAITRVKHLKTDKKDAEAKDVERKEDSKENPLEGRVMQICRAGLGRVLSGRNAEELHQLTYAGQNPEDAWRFEDMRAQMEKDAIEQCEKKLIYYGVELTQVELIPVVRADAEVQAQALRTLSPSEGAIAASTNGHVVPPVEAEEGKVVHISEAEAAQQRAAQS
jgi:hypothetical protein